MSLKQNAWTRIDLELPADPRLEIVYSPPYVVDGFYYCSWPSEDAQREPTMVLTKLTADGHAVDAFGSHGTVRIPMPGERGQWLNFVVHDQHLICAVTLRVNQQFVIFRLRTDSGDLDRSFGHQGFEIVPFPEETDSVLQTPYATVRANPDYAGSVPQFPDGKLRQQVNSGLAQFDVEGKLDRSFNKNGMRRYFRWQNTNLYTMGVQARYEAVDHAGFYYYGAHRVGGDDVQAWVGACDSNGTPVSSFADQGVWIVNRLPGHSHIAHLTVSSALQLNERLYMVGAAGDSGFVHCLDLNGRPDQAFNDGNALVFERSEFDRTLGMAVVAHGDGVLVAFVQAYFLTGEMPVAIVRLKPDGQVDTGFGDQGWLLTPSYPRSETMLVTEHADQQVIEIRGSTFIARYPL